MSIVINGFDCEKELEEICRTKNNNILMKNSIADYSSEYRSFSKNIFLDYSILDECINTFTNHILIQCYTFSEQLLKNTIYHLLHEENRNQYITKFIDNKIPQLKFSPNPRLEEFQKELDKYYDIKYKFIFSIKTNSAYNTMIEYRHQYAHACNIQYGIDYDSVVKTLELLVYEMKFLFTTKKKFENNITIAGNIRKEYQENFEEMKKSVDYLCVEKDSLHNKALKEKLKKLKENLKNINKLYKKIPNVIHESLIEKLIHAEKSIDLRKKEIDFQKIEELRKELRMLQIL